MRSILSILLLLLLATVSNAQTTNVKAQAEQMGRSLLQKDYKTFVTFSYPAILTQMGGAEKMEANIARQMEGMEAGGAKIIGLTYGSPSPVVKEGKELQCTIPQHMLVQLSAGKVASSTTLIALSADEGNRWYFVDAGERDLATVRKSLPNVSKALKIVKPGPPKLVK
jgi:hypothetical protein